MKKLLFAFASLALISNAVAQEGADMKWNAEMRFRFTNTENEGFDKSANDNETQQRTKIGATMTKGEDLTATVTLLNASTWGNAGAGNTSGELISNGSDSEIYVYEAFAFWKAMDNFALKIGRGALDLADGSVIAKNDWEQTPWSFEGAYGAYFTEWANIGLFGVKGMNDESGATVGGNTADINFYGLSVDVKNLPEWLKMVNIHALQSKATGVGGTLGFDEKLRLGLTVKGDSSAVDYRLSYAMYDGETSVGGTADHEASMLDAEVGFSMPDVMNMRISALYHMDSGSSATATKNETYDAFFYERHANAGLMDIIGWGNSTYIKVGVALEPMEMTKVGLDYYMFTKTEKDDSVYNYSATSGTGNLTAIAGTAGTDDDVGSEIDVWATKMLSNGAELNARLGFFQAGDAFGTSPEDITQASLGATFRF
ncbi:MAG: alginate export family protein [Bdellovibrionota bacterium]